MLSDNGIFLFLMPPVLLRSIKCQSIFLSTFVVFCSIDEAAEEHHS